MLCFAALVFAAVLAGFGRTFLVPFARGRFEPRPWFVYAHAALFFVWVTLLIVQAWLAARRQVRWHQRLGWIGFPLVPLMAASGIAVSVWATRRDLALGQAEAIPFFAGLLMDMLLFFAFASAALLMRRRPAVHKRLMLFATIAILGAAFARIPAMEGLGNSVAVALVLAIGAYDIRIERRIRPVSYIGGLLLLAGIFSETPLGELRAWERAGPVVLAWFSPQ
jgi:hypothetical protein